MCDLAVDVDAVARTHETDVSVFADAFDRLTPLAADGIVAIHGSRVAVTDPGRPFVRLVAAVFDAYLQHGGKKHSRAV